MKKLAFIVLLLPVLVYSQKIQQLDLPAGATDLIDPPYKRFQHLIEEGNITTRNIVRHRDRTELKIDYSFSGEVISAEVDIEGVRIEQAYVNYSLVNGLTIEGGRILQMDESLQEAEEFFNQEGPSLDNMELDQESLPIRKKFHDLYYHHPGIPTDSATWWFFK